MSVKWSHAEPGVRARKADRSTHRVPRGDDVNTSTKAENGEAQQEQAGDGAEALPYTLALVKVADLTAHPENKRDRIEFGPGFLDSLKADGVVIPLLAT